MKANQIPMNKRPDVRRMKQLTEEVNYLIVHKIDTEQKMEARIIGLQQAFMQAEKVGNKEAVRQVKKEMEVCERCKNAKVSLVKEKSRGTQI